MANNVIISRPVADALVQLHARDDNSLRLELQSAKAAITAKHRSNMLLPYPLQELSGNVILNTFSPLLDRYAPDVVRLHRGDKYAVLNLSNDDLLNLANGDLQIGIPIIQSLKIKEQYAKLLKNDRQKILSFIDIANFYRKSNFFQHAERTLQAAERAAILIPDNEEKSKILIDITYELFNLARFYQHNRLIQYAGTVLQKAEEAANLILNNEKKSKLLLNIAQTFQKFINNPAAERVLQKAEEATILILDDEKKSNILSNIVDTYIRIENLPAAERAVLLIPNYKLQCKELLSIAFQYNNRGNLQDAKRATQAAEKAARLIPNDEQKSNALYDLTALYIQSGRNLVEAERVARLIPHHKIKSDALDYTAHQYHLARNTQQFRRIQLIRYKRVLYFTGAALAAISGVVLSSLYWKQ